MTDEVLVMKENIIATKSYNFAVKIVTLCKALIANKEYVLSRQLLKSGTSIGANVEAIGRISKNTIQNYTIFKGIIKLLIIHY